MSMLYSHRLYGDILTVSQVCGQIIWFAKTDILVTLPIVFAPVTMPLFKDVVELIPIGSKAFKDFEQAINWLGYNTGFMKSGLKDWSSCSCYVNIRFCIIHHHEIILRRIWYSLLLIKPIAATGFGISKRV